MTLYFLAIIPPENICKGVKSLKEEIAEKYEAKNALKLPAHITLQIPFKIPESEEEKLVELLIHFTENQQAFEINLKDFGRFSQKVIFINIQQHEEIIKLHANLQQVLNKNFNFKKHGKFSKVHPHITLASRDLHYKQFPNAWADFKDREFQASFTAKSLALLKHHGNQWHMHYEFKFK